MSSFTEHFPYKVRSVAKRFREVWGILPSFPVIVCLFIYLMNGCVIPFDPEIDEYDNLLVVDGLLTNEAGSCEVRLTRTYPYNRRNFQTEKNASVEILDDIGNITILKDVGNGKYKPEDENFAGEVGRKYKVRVETQSGESCESDFEELKEPVPIDNIYYKYENKGNGLKGLQLYVDSYDPLNKSFYYLWDYKETWEFWVPYVPQSVFLPEMKICYKTFDSRTFNIKSTKDYREDKIIGFPLYFIDNTTNRLSVKYSTLIKQYVLTEQTYNFYHNLKAINEEVGSLYDRIPVILVGNIHNSDNPDLPILGNFQVSGVSVKRIFILNEDLPSDLYIPSEFEYCEVTLVSEKSYKDRLDSFLGEGWAVMDTFIEEMDITDTVYGLAISRACFDCKLNGDINMPDFWLDE